MAILLISVMWMIYEVSFFYLNFQVWYKLKPPIPSTKMTWTLSEVQFYFVWCQRKLGTEWREKDSYSQCRCDLMNLWNLCAWFNRNMCSNVTNAYHKGFGFWHKLIQIGSSKILRNCRLQDVRWRYHGFFLKFLDFSFDVF